MLDAIKSIYAFALDVANTLPPSWRAALTGVVACLLLTQWAKHWLPNCLRSKERSLAAELIGFAVGALVVAVFDPAPTAERALHACLVGLTGPLCYRVVVALTVRRWPVVADALSQDT